MARRAGGKRRAGTLGAAGAGGGAAAPRRLAGGFAAAGAVAGPAATGGRDGAAAGPAAGGVHLAPRTPSRAAGGRAGAHRRRMVEAGGEMRSVRDYFRVEDEEGRRFWLFRRGDGEDVATGDLRWFLHGFFWGGRNLEENGRWLVRVRSVRFVAVDLITKLAKLSKLTKKGVHLQDEAFQAVFQHFAVKIHQQANSAAAQPEIGHHLRFMHRQDALDRLDFDDHRVSTTISARYPRGRRTPS